MPVYACVSARDENYELLKPYMKDLVVNCKHCRVLRDSAATMDVVHPNFLSSSDYLSECAWVRQVADENSVCLPMAKVRIEGPFGTLETEAAVSRNLPQQYPYLFSNRSEALLLKRGTKFSEGEVMALTRAKARELSQRLDYAPSKQSESTKTLVDTVEVNSGDSGPDRQVTAAVEEPTPLFLPPTSTSFDILLRVDKETLAREQQSDSNLQKEQNNVKEGICAKDVTFVKRGGVLSRQYQDRKGRRYDQLAMYRADVMQLSHGNAWAGHLGIRETKQKLLQEFYWSGCFKDAENFVRSCDACQRLGNLTKSGKHHCLRSLLFQSLSGGS